jgi:hypothetical protein
MSFLANTQIAAPGTPPSAPSSRPVSLTARP